MPLDIIEVQAIDHHWIWWKSMKRYLCPLCGAVTGVKPPHPTPDDWLPERYIPLTKEHKALAPKQ